jgi:glucosamine kinase
VSNKLTLGYWYFIGIIARRGESSVELVLGIDGGGTSCRAALATAAGKIVGRGRSGPANITTDLAGARENIVEAARLAFVDAGRDPALIPSTAALLGLAGTNVGDYKERLVSILPFRESVVESDALIALDGALGDHGGAIAIVGTGSIFVSRKGGVLHTVGGWGFILGDLGGGARLGRDLLEEALLAYDRIRPTSPLAEAVLAKFGDKPGPLVDFAVTAKPRDFGAYAPMVFEYSSSGDPLAARLIARAVAHLEDALDALNLSARDWLCALGGLAELMAPHFSDRYRAILRPPLQDALGGAVSMAVRHFCEQGQGGHG